MKNNYAKLSLKKIQMFSVRTSILNLCFLVFVLMLISNGSEAQYVAAKQTSIEKSKQFSDTPVSKSDFTDNAKFKPYGKYKLSDEKVEKRDAFSKHFRNNDGSVTAVISQSPIHYLDKNKKWQDIRTDIRLNNTGSNKKFKYAVTENKYQSYFSEKLSDGFMISMPEGDFQFGTKNQIMLVGADDEILKTIDSKDDATVTVNDDRITYNNSYTFAYDEFVEKRTGIDHDIILSEKPSFLNDFPEAKSLVVREFVRLPQGWKVISQEEINCKSCGNVKNKKGLAVVDNNGNVIMEFLTPAIMEKNTREIYHANSEKGAYTEYKVKTTSGTFKVVNAVGGVFVETYVSLSWLTDPDRVYPVVIDPAVVCYAYNTGGETGFSNVDQNCYCGDDVCGDNVRWQGGETYEGWMYFNTASIPDGSTIVYTDLNFNAWEVNIPYYYLRAMSTHTDVCVDLWSIEHNGGVYQTILSTVVGWNLYSLGSAASTDLQNQLASDFFGVAFNEYESSSSYYAFAYGYYQNSPYITVGYNDAPCTNCGIQNPAGTYTTTSSSWTQITDCQYAGQWTQFSLDANYIYQWNSFGTTWNTQLTLFGSGTACTVGDIIGNNDDYGGSQSLMAYTPGQTSVRVLTSEYICGSNTTCGYSNWRAIPLTPTVSASSTFICSGAQVTLGATNISDNDAYVNVRWGTSPGGTDVSSDATSVIVTPGTTTTYYCQYEVLAGGSPGTQYSNSASITITVGSIPLEITSPPANADICEGANTSFSVTANGSGLTYQWQLSTDGGLNFNNITAAGTNPVYSDWQTSTLNLTSVVIGNNNYRYRCVVNDACLSTLNSEAGILTVTAGSAASISILASPGGPVCTGTLVTFTATIGNGGTSPVYVWKLNGSPVGGNSSTYSSSSLVTGNSISCQLTSNLQCVTGSPATSNLILMIVKPSLTAGITIETPTNPACSHSLVYFYATPENGGTTPHYQWKLNGNPVGNDASTYSNNNLSSTNVVSCVLTSNEACVVGNPATSNDIVMVISPTPTADAGTNVTYTSTPVSIGSFANGPGTITWSPSSGLNNATIEQPLASPAYTTIYTISVDNAGCVRTDDVIVTVVGSGYMIGGKTMYAGKANAGNPAPNLPTYNPKIYDINKVIVILKNQSGTEISRDTSDVNGVFAFNNVSNGNYILSYDKFTADTMQWGDNVNAIDVALMKYLIGSDIVTDPSRNFTSIYKKAANVDNNTSVNAIDVARIKAKIGAPDIPAKNFPKGNWVKMDTAITVSSANVNIILPVICYGDYNASSSKYRDSASTWSSVKSFNEDIVSLSDESLIITDPSYFEIPLRINHKFNEFSAMGLELRYPDNEYQLVTAEIPKSVNKNLPVKINPTLEEIISDNNDLLVTDRAGIIRVIYATTHYFNLAGNETVIKLGFKPLNSILPGLQDFSLTGTGVFANQYGEEQDVVFLQMPRVFVQANGDGAEFEFTAYPNPFSGDAVINYNLPESGHTSLKVYNVIGELVTELVNENQLSGKHTVIFSGNELPAGMYTFRLDFSGDLNSNCAVLKMIR